MSPPRVISAEVAIVMLDVQPAREVAWTSKDGTLRDDDGDAIDPRQAVPWVWAIGPFGTWPETAESAIVALECASSIQLSRSMRTNGPAVFVRAGWGYAAKGRPGA